MKTIIALAFAASTFGFSYAPVMAQTLNRCHYPQYPNLITGECVSTNGWTYGSTSAGNTFHGKPKATPVVTPPTEEPGCGPEEPAGPGPVGPTKPERPSKPGKGWSDKNHKHTGAPGHNKPKNDDKKPGKR